MIAIKGVEMPKSCAECGFCSYNESIGYVCKAIYTSITRVSMKDKRLDNCPLEETEERKIGKWLVKDNGNGSKYVECPFCGALAPHTEFADRIVWKYSKFCYDCGNELEGPENE